MPETPRYNEACKAASNSPFHSMVAKFRESKLGAVLSLISALAATGCVPERIQLRPDQCDDYRASTYRNSDGTHGFNEIVVFPANSTDKEFRCIVRPECRKFNKNEKKPDTKDCVDWSKPCIEQ